MLKIFLFTILYMPSLSIASCNFNNEAENLAKTFHKTTQNEFLEKMAELEQDSSLTPFIHEIESDENRARIAQLDQTQIITIFQQAREAYSKLTLSVFESLKAYAFYSLNDIDRACMLDVNSFGFSDHTYQRNSFLYLPPLLVKGLYVTNMIRLVIIRLRQIFILSIFLKELL